MSIIEAQIEALIIARAYDIASSMRCGKTYQPQAFDDADAVVHSWLGGRLDCSAPTVALVAGAVALLAFRDGGVIYGGVSYTAQMSRRGVELEVVVAHDVGAAVGRLFDELPFAPAPVGDFDPCPHCGGKGLAPIIPTSPYLGRCVECDGAGAARELDDDERDIVFAIEALSFVEPEGAIDIEGEPTSTVDDGLDFASLNDLLANVAKQAAAHRRQQIDGFLQDVDPFDPFDPFDGEPV